MGRTLARTLVVFGVSLWTLQPARAVDGVIEINATLAAAGNVTAGDAPGFPVEINESGSYRLTSNLVVPPGVSGIVISASGTQLDLNGFTISSTTVCSGNPLNCTPAAGGIGIEDPIVDSVSVRNGRVTGFGGSGVILGDSARAEKLQVDNNAYQGIQAGSAAVVADSIVRLNGGQGVSVGPDSRVVSNVVSTNGAIGIGAPQSALVDRNSVNHNAGGSSGVVGHRNRRFYVTRSPVAGADATTHCDAGFHMASLWEIQEPSLFTYDRERGILGSGSSEWDNGQGPPVGVGWIRTGYPPSTTSGNIAGLQNCSSWTSSSSTVSGSVAELNPIWLNPGSPTQTGYAWPWTFGTTACSNPEQVWCVED
ncbi:MAG TPA: hypothetical protein VMR50_07970 [Myxococcota bacterium]|nr:hypothetical protein [Myxococcota bacterium]